MSYDAIIIGSGPNGLAAGITLLRTGRRVAIFEAQSKGGGALCTAEVTLEGFRHDVNAGVFPMAMVSPFFKSLPLKEYGLEWVHAPTPLAHPFIVDGTDKVSSVALEHDIFSTAQQFGKYSVVYQAMMEYMLEHQDVIHDFVLKPILGIPKDPIKVLPFAAASGVSSTFLSQILDSPKFRLLFTGLAAHSAQPLHALGSSAIALMLGLTGHSHGWPMVRGGAGRLGDILIRIFTDLGGHLYTSTTITDCRDLPSTDVVLADMSPHAIAKVFESQLPTSYIKRLQAFKYGPGVFKIDYALDGPVPWRDTSLNKAGTLHVGNTPEEIALAEWNACKGLQPERPFLIAAQPSLFDSSVAPAGKHTFWAYAHIPNGSGQLMTNRIEQQLERYAPGFRDLVLARYVSGPVRLQQQNRNLIGGDVTGGANSLLQLIARPTLLPKSYRTPCAGLYICSASTPPGAGIHGMSGFQAAQAVIHDQARDSRKTFGNR